MEKIELPSGALARIDGNEITLYDSVPPKECIYDGPISVLLELVDAMRPAVPDDAVELAANLHFDIGKRMIEQNAALITEWAAKRESAAREVQHKEAAVKEMMEYSVSKEPFLWIRAIERIRAITGNSLWKSISSAPRDGTRILVWADTHMKTRRGHAVIAYWGFHQHIPEATWLWHDGKEWMGPDVATHWQPLPTPPITNEGE